MKLHNEFFVHVPIDRAWKTLLDIETVAGFLPGAKIEPGGPEGVYQGSMKVKVGPMTVNYQGTARLATVDEQGHSAEIEVRAKEAKGQGTAAAVIRNTLREEDGGTRVTAETDLQVTGRQAQFGRGIMQDVASRMLDDFAGRFEAYLTSAGAGSSGANGATNGSSGSATAQTTPAPPPPTEDALDLGSVMGQLPIVRYGVPAFVLGLVLIWLLGRRR